MTSPPSRPGFGALIAGSFRAMGRHGEVLALVTLLWAALSMLASYMVRDEVRQIQQAQDDMQAMAGALSEAAGPMLLFGLVSLLINSVFYGIWPRIVVFGRGEALRGNPAGHFVTILWRGISLAGYCLLLLLGAFLVLLVLQVLVGALGLAAGGGDGAVAPPAGAGIAGMLLGLIIGVAFFTVFTAYQLAVAATALGQTRTILQGLQRLRRLWWPLMPAIFFVYLGFLLIASLIVGVMTGGEGTPGFAARLIASAFGTLGSLFALTAAALCEAADISAAPAEEGEA